MEEVWGYDNLPDNKKLDYREYVMWEPKELAILQLKLQEVWWFDNLTKNEQNEITRLRNFYKWNNEINTPKIIKIGESELFNIKKNTNIPEELDNLEKVDNLVGKIYELNNSFNFTNEDEIKKIIEEQFQKYEKEDIKEMISYLKGRLGTIKLISKHKKSDEKEAISFYESISNISNEIYNKIPLTNSQSELLRKKNQSDINKRIFEKGDFVQYENYVRLVDEWIMVKDAQYNYPVFNYDKLGKKFVWFAWAKKNILVVLKPEDFLQYFKNLKEDKFTNFNDFNH